MYVFNQFQLFCNFIVRKFTPSPQYSQKRRQFGSGNTMKIDPLVLINRYDLYEYGLAMNLLEISACSNLR